MIPVVKLRCIKFFLQNSCENVCFCQMNNNLNNFSHFTLSAMGRPHRACTLIKNAYVSQFSIEDFQYYGRTFKPKVNPMTPREGGVRLPLTFFKSALFSKKLMGHVQYFCLTIQVTV